MTALRRCAHCGEPLRASARADARYCGPACRAAAGRARRYHAEAVEIGFAIVSGNKADVGRRCPVCGHWFIPGHGRRRDSLYDEDKCRSAAYRARRRASRASRLRVAAGRNDTAHSTATAV
ncbi:hypothetical protein LKL35_36735 [Streptomyces sp. ET3-23]|uniref:hypothetical protein n=1 Tax=Streptomyces sp. ET3-23 TaxID=2885643 RepID=UPI001D0F8614|nr:hypothetical protein [Streptomyces sp. ET3-23]MCC2280873.1 hypothetical protein [Streptomyces sp. ET3-23]